MTQVIRVNSSSLTNYLYTHVTVSYEFNTTVFKEPYYISLPTFVFLCNPI